MTVDPSRPLKKDAHEAFAAHYALNGNAAAAWVHATGGSPEYSDGNGSKWLGRGSISARVDWLRAEAERMLRAKEDKKQRPILLSIVRKREICAEIAENTEAEPMPRLKAIQVDNDLSGDGSEAKANDAVVTFAERLAQIRSRKKQ